MVMGCREDYASSPSGSEVAFRIRMLLDAAGRPSGGNWIRSIRYGRWLKRRRCFGGPCWIMAVDGAEDDVEIGIFGCCLPRSDGRKMMPPLYHRCSMKLLSARWSSPDADDGGTPLPLVVDAVMLATGFCWIWPIRIGYKNRALTMPPPDLKGMPIGDGEDDIQPARVRIQPTMHAAAVLGGLWSRRIWGQLVVTDVQDGLDRPFECSLVVGSVVAMWGRWRDGLDGGDAVGVGAIRRSGRGRPHRHFAGVGSAADERAEGCLSFKNTRPEVGALDCSRLGCWRYRHPMDDMELAAIAQG
ncbi:hypothetical protein ACLOJK_008939 [Asimina triloba]